MDRIRQLVNAKKPCHTAHRIGVIAFEEGLKCWLIIQDSKKIHFGDRNSCVQGTKCTQSLMLYEILFPLLSATIYVRSAKAPKRRKKKRRGKEMRPNTRIHSQSCNPLERLQRHCQLIERAAFLLLFECQYCANWGRELNIYVMKLRNSNNVNIRVARCTGKILVFRRN